MEDFKQLFLNIINFGWKDSNYFEHLVKVANDSNKLAKLKCKVENSLLINVLASMMRCGV